MSSTNNRMLANNCLFSQWLLAQDTVSHLFVFVIPDYLIDFPHGMSKLILHAIRLQLFVTAEQVQ
jgi:hypothetical protein